eukprot:2056764-Rhodomonas_salina.1
MRQVSRAERHPLGQSRAARRGRRRYLVGDAVVSDERLPVIPPPCSPRIPVSPARSSHRARMRATLLVEERVGVSRVPDRL